MLSTVVALATVVLLWVGRLLPEAGKVEVALGGYLLTLAAWFALGPWQLRGSLALLKWRSSWLATGALWGVGLVLVSAGAYLISARLLGLEPPAEQALVGGGGVVRSGLLVGVVLTSAVLEEWVFRGVLLEGLGGLPPMGAVVASATVFAAYHLSLFQLLPTFALGVGLALLVQRSGSLVPAVLAHSLFNLAGLLLSAAMARGQGV